MWLSGQQQEGKGGFCFVYICFFISVFWMSKFPSLSEIEQLSPEVSRASAAHQFQKPCEDSNLELKNWRRNPGNQIYLAQREASPYKARLSNSEAPPLRRMGCIPIPNICPHFFGIGFVLARRMDKGVEAPPQLFNFCGCTKSPFTLKNCFSSFLHEWHMSTSRRLLSATAQPPDSPAGMWIRQHSSQPALRRS